LTTVKTVRAGRQATTLSKPQIFASHPIQFWMCDRDDTFSVHVDPHAMRRAKSLSILE
jgi:hypothetical protein